MSSGIPIPAPLDSVPERRSLPLAGLLALLVHRDVLCEVATKILVHVAAAVTDFFGNRSNFEYLYQEICAMKLIFITFLYL